MKQPLLSICIPTYNNALWLEYSLRRILPQLMRTVDFSEVVVTDNCSKDETEDVLESLATEFETGFRYARNEKNLGHNGNYQRCIQLAKGDFIWLIGTDDILQNDAIERLLEFIQANQDLDYFYCNYSKFTPGNRPHETAALQSFPISSTGSSDRRNYRVEKVRELVKMDFNTFSPMYVNVMRRPLMLEAAEWGMQGPLFSTLETTVSFGAYVIERMLDEPAFYIGEPLLAASSALSWTPFAPIYATTMFPDMYRRLRRNGVPNNVLADHYRKSIRIAQRSLSHLMTHPMADYRNQFSFWKYFKQHWRFGVFWLVLLQIFPQLVKYWCSRHYWAWKLGRLKEK